MTQIIQNYSSLKEYTHNVKHNPQILKPKSCEECGCLHFWLNGTYPRKISGRDQDKKAQEPIDILRFKCSRCKQSYSIIPSPIALYRWYLWCLQLQVLLSLLQGASFYAVAKEYAISRDTASRWYHWLISSFKQFQLALCAEYPQFAVFNDTEAILFYRDLLRWRDLSQLAQFWHAENLLIPYQWRRANE